MDKVVAEGEIEIYNVLLRPRESFASTGGASWEEVDASVSELSRSWPNGSSSKPAGSWSGFLPFATASSGGKVAELVPLGGHSVEDTRERRTFSSFLRRASSWVN